MSSEQTTEQIPGPIAKKRRSPVDFLIVVIIIVLAVTAARYQEEIQGFFRLHAWDRGAPGQAVVEFLKAGKNRDRAQADSYIGSPLYQPFLKDGVWLGYSTTVQTTKVLYTFEDLIPATSLQPTSTEFNYVGDGSADVVIPDKQGNPVTYSLVRLGNRWKIISIRGGKMEQARG